MTAAAGEGPEDAGFCFRWRGSAGSQGSGCQLMHDPSLGCLVVTLVVPEAGCQSEHDPCRLIPAKLSSLPWCGALAPVLQIGAGDTYRMKTAAKPQTPVSMRQQCAPSSSRGFWRSETVYAFKCGPLTYCSRATSCRTGTHVPGTKHHTVASTATCKHQCSCISVRRLSHSPHYVPCPCPYCSCSSLAQQQRPACSLRGPAAPRAAPCSAWAAA